MKKIWVMMHSMAFLVIAMSINAVEIVSYGVDGKVNNPEVVIQNRYPVFHWAFTGTYERFEIKVANTLAGVDSSPVIWGSPMNSQNTVDNITRAEITADSYGDPFVEGTTYFYRISLFDITGTSVSVTGQFTVVATAVTLDQLIDLKIDWNNPFDPARGEVTKIRYTVKEKDLPVKVHIFTISGKHVQKLVDHTALQGITYSLVWDGKDSAGNVCLPGVYVVTLVATDSKLFGFLSGSKPVTALVSIIKR